MTHDLITAGERVFVSQARLDDWAGHGRIALHGLSLTVAGREGRQHALEPAIRFLRVAGGGADAHGLVSRILTSGLVRELGGEPQAGSVVVGDTAYEVEGGYLAEPATVAEASHAAPLAPRVAPAPHARPLPPDLEPRRRDAEALARFLLDNLS
jgi:hypothetical protein